MEYRFGVADDALWIFGYGSLVWRPAFAFEHCEPATISGWVRRFWQASPDHRGLPANPGRVVTLLRHDDPTLSREALGISVATDPRNNADDRSRATCWGTAYRVADSDRDSVLAELDFRERAGYERVEVDIALESDVCSGFVYVAGPRNPNFIGPETIDDIAQRIHRAVGPSGPNPEYVFKLADRLRASDAHDEHVFAVETAVRAIGDRP